MDKLTLSGSFLLDGSPVRIVPGVTGRVMITLYNDGVKGITDTNEVRRLIFAGKLTRLIA